MASAAASITADLHTVKVQLLLLKDRLMDEQDVSLSRRLEYKKYLTDLSEAVSGMMAKEAAIRKSFMEEFGKVREDCARIVRNKSGEIEEMKEKLSIFVRTVHSRFVSQTKTAEEAIKVLSSQLDSRHKSSEFNSMVKDFIKQQAEVKSFRSRLCSQLSSVKKHCDSSREKHPCIGEFSLCHESKHEDLHLLSCFDRAAAFMQPSRGDPQSRFAGGKAEASQPIESRQVFSSHKKSQPSEMDLPDFTMESVTQKEADSARIADQYEPFASRQRALLNVELEDVMGARSLPISLKGSSTFQ